MSSIRSPRKSLCRSNGCRKKSRCRAFYRAGKQVGNDGKRISCGFAMSQGVGAPNPLSSLATERESRPLREETKISLSRPILIRLRWFSLFLKQEDKLDATGNEKLAHFVLGMASALARRKKKIFFGGSSAGQNFFEWLIFFLQQHHTLKPTFDLFSKPHESKMEQRGEQFIGAQKPGVHLGAPRRGGGYARRRGRRRGPRETYRI